MMVVPALPPEARLLPPNRPTAPSPFPVTPSAPGAGRTSSLAVASLICSLTFCFGCIPGIICGHLAQRNIRRDPTLRGGGLAIAGLCISYFGLLLTLGAIGLGMAGFVRGFKEAWRVAQQEQTEEAAHGTSTAMDSDTNSLWNMDLANAEFSDQPAQGRIRGEDFKVTSATVRNGVITFRQGSGDPLQRQVMLFTSMTNNSMLAGKTYAIAPSDMELAGEKMPAVHVAWKNPSGRGQRARVFQNGYALKLALGAEGADARIPGRIYLCLPDNEQSYVAGTFTLELNAPPARRRGPKKPQSTNSN